MFWRSSNGGASTGTLTPALPTGWQVDDLFVLAIETNPAEPPLAPAGWTEFSFSPMIGAATRLTMFWKRAVLGDVAPALGDPGDHITANIVCIAGALLVGDPFESFAVETESGTTSLTWPGVTPSAIGHGVLMVTGTGRDSTASILNTVTWDKTEAATRAQDLRATNANGGGGINQLFGLVDTAGTINMSSTLVGSDERHNVSLVIIPEPDPNISVHNDHLVTVVAKHLSDGLVYSNQLVTVVDEMGLNQIVYSNQLVVVVVEPQDSRRKGFMSFCP